jgi:hypothetical protein
MGSVFRCALARDVDPCNALVALLWVRAAIKSPLASGPGDGAALFHNSSSSHMIAAGQYASALLLQVIPYLTVYAVLPSSLGFLLAYSYASQRLARPALFNAIVAGFMAFFVVFAFGLYPHHATLHPHDFADALLQVQCGALIVGLQAWVHAVCLRLLAEDSGVTYPSSVWLTA